MADLADDRCGAA